MNQINTAHGIQDTIQRLSWNVPPKFADSAIIAFFKGKDLSAAKEDLLSTADRIAESGEEAATGKNWACSTFEKLKELCL